MSSIFKNIFFIFSSAPSCSHQIFRLNKKSGNLFYLIFISFFKILFVFILYFSAIYFVFFTPVFIDYYEIIFCTFRYYFFIARERIFSPLDRIFSPLGATFSLPLFITFYPDYPRRELLLCLCFPAVDIFL